MTRLRVLVVDPGQQLGGAQLYVSRLAGPLRERGVDQVLAAPAGSELAQAWRAGGGEQVTLESTAFGSAFGSTDLESAALGSTYLESAAFGSTDLESAALGSVADRSIRRANGGLSPTRALRELGRTASSARRIAALARRAGADVLHGNAHWTHLEVAAAGRLCRRPAVLHLHEQSRPDALGRLRALGVVAAAASVAVSDAVALSLPAWSRRRLRVIHSGIDMLRFHPGPGKPALRAMLTRGDPSAAVVLVLARLVPTKGIDHVIQAVAGLPGRTHLVIAGDPADPGYARVLHQQGEQLLGERVQFLGARTDVADLLRASDALVLASESEGLGLCILEAQACGIPVIAYPAGGCAELIRHNTTGLLAEQGNATDLGRQLDRLLSDPALGTQLSARALTHVRRHHSLAEQADRYVDVLRSVVPSARLG